eukprot:Skav210440  [mRNA]  locus=scaffold1297:81192:85455:+ [translate_table: standard]
MIVARDFYVRSGHLLSHEYRASLRVPRAINERSFRAAQSSFSMVNCAAPLVLLFLLARAKEVPMDREKARPLMRRHHSGSVRAAAVSHNAVIALDAPWTDDSESAKDNAQRPELKERIAPEILVDFSTDLIGDHQSEQFAKVIQISLRHKLWLASCLSGTGCLITCLYLYARRGHEVAPEESLPPPPGSVTGTLQILCITSLSISYGAMVSSMTIFVLPKEAEHFFPKQSSISLGFLELLGAVSLLSSPIAGQGLAQIGLHHTYIYAVQAGLTYLFLPVTHFSSQEAGSHDMLLPSNPVSLRTVFWMGDSKNTDYILVLWERGFYYASAASKSFLLYFVRDILGIIADKDQALLLAEASVSTVGAAILGGLLSSVLFTRTSIRPQSIASCGSLILAIGTQFWVCLFFHNLKLKKMVLLLFFAVYGFGKGSYMSADLALGIATMPDPDEASRYMGLWGLSAFLGAGLGGFAMSMILQLFGEILPASYGMKLKPGSYCIHGYICLLLVCFCCQVYVAHVCLRIRTRAEHEQGLVKVQRSKTNAFLVESFGTPTNKAPGQHGLNIFLVYGPWKKASLSSKL